MTYEEYMDLIKDEDKNVREMAKVLCSILGGKI